MEVKGEEGGKEREREGKREKTRGAEEDRLKSG